MKVLLDECLPRRLTRDLTAHEVTTVPKQGWAGITNGELIAKAEVEFDVFITIDSNLIHQQRLSANRLGIIVLHAVNSRYETLEPLIPAIQREVEGLSPGVVVHIPNAGVQE